jgi:dolichol-phosphate mannosyltransferase
MESSIVVIPTYDEIENIEKLIRIILDLDCKFDILVVDDSSPDKTANKVKELIPIFEKRLFLKVRKRKEGLGKAYIDGFNWALEKKYDFIFQMDADFSHNPENLIEMLFKLKNGGEVIIGSRYVKGTNVVNWPLSRILLSKFASFYVNTITGMPIKDPTSGYVGFRKDVLKSISLEKIKFVGYAFQIELKYKAWIKNYLIEEHSIIFKNRERGFSKMNSSIIWEAIYGVIILRILGKK